MEIRILLGSSPKDLEKLINKYLSDSWRLRGPIKAVTRDTGRGKDWIQMMWRKEVVEDAQPETTNVGGHS